MSVDWFLADRRWGCFLEGRKVSVAVTRMSRDRTDVRCECLRPGAAQSLEG